MVWKGKERGGGLPEIEDLYYHSGLEEVFQIFGDIPCVGWQWNTWLWTYLLYLTELKLCLIIKFTIFLCFVRWEHLIISSTDFLEQLYLWNNFIVGMLLCLKFVHFKYCIYFLNSLFRDSRFNLFWFSESPNNFFCSVLIFINIKPIACVSKCSWD